MPTENEKPESETGDVEVQDPGRTEFANIAENIVAIGENLRKMPNLNPQTLRQHLLNDLYPLLQDWAEACNWYTGDLHARVSEVEEEVGEEGEEGLDPEFASELIEFIGVSLQLFGVLVNICKNDPEVIGKVQLLIAKAPGLIAKINEITLEEEEEEEEGEEEEEEPEVLEPKVRPVTSTASAESTPVLEVEAVQVTPEGISFTPKQQPVEPPPPATGGVSEPDVVAQGSTADPNPDAVVTTTTSGTESANG